MKTIKEHIQNVNESMMINEALTAKVLRKAAAELRSIKSKFNDVFRAEVRWDLVTNGDIKEYPATESSKKAIRKAIQDRKTIICESDDKIRCVVWGEQYITISDKGINAFRDKPTSILYILLDQDKFDTLYVVDAEEVPDKWKLRGERLNGREGMIPVNNAEASLFDDSYWCDPKKSLDRWLEKFASNQFERYKKIVSQNRALKSNDFDEIDKRVQELFQRVMKLQSDIARGDKKYDGSTFEITHIVDLFMGNFAYNGHKLGVLALVRNYFEKLRAIQTNQSYNIDRDKEELNQLKNDITDRCNEIESKIDKIG